MKVPIRKVIIKCILFAAIFVLLWQASSSVLEYDWNQREYLGIRYEELKEERTPDVLFVGASNTYADIAPAVSWDECGFTGYNLGTSDDSMMLMYHQLKYALQIQKPKLVVIDISGMSVEKDLLNREARYEAVYRKVVATMPDLKLRAAIINKICDQYENQDAKTYWFPMLRYHSRWDELTQNDFNDQFIRNQYQDFRKGCHLNRKIMHLTWPEDVFNHKRQLIPQYGDYLEEMIAMCRDQDIEVMLVLYPKVDINEGDHTSAVDYAKQYGLNYLSFTTEEEVKAAGLDLHTDFYDLKHLNLLGQEKFSRYMARYLDEHYSFDSHAGDGKLVKEWDQAYTDYMAYYKENTKDMPVVKSEQK